MYTCCVLTVKAFNSTNLDVFVPSASTDTDSILPSCLAFLTSVELKAFDGHIEHTKTLPSVITHAGVTLPLLLQSHSLLWRPAKCHSPAMCVEMNSKQVSCVGFVGTGLWRRDFRRWESWTGDAPRQKDTSKSINSQVVDFGLCGQNTTNNNLKSCWKLFGPLLLLFAHFALLINSFKTRKKHFKMQFYHQSALSKSYWQTENICSRVLWGLICVHPPLSQDQSLCPCCCQP